MSRLKIDPVKLAALSAGLKNVNNKLIPPTLLENKVLEYVIKFTSGDVLYAEGEHADVLVRYLEECQHLASENCLTMYTGPGLRKFSPQEWLQFIGNKIFKKDVN